MSMEDRLARYVGIWEEIAILRYHGVEGSK